MQTFWQEVAPASHVVQIYEDEKSFLNLLEGFVAGGITVGDSVIAIATSQHLNALEARLSSHGLDVAALAARDQYIALDAEETMKKFMVDDWPDYNLFMATMTALFDKARQSRRNIRAFGEMVALLWQKGKSGATVMLEYLWNTFSEKEHFSLFCAYPQAAFSQNSHTALKNICGTHTKLISNWGNSKTEMLYQQVS